jgi:adenine-specific DNA-methyltransferase
MSEDDFWDFDADDRIWWGDDGNNVPAIKRFLSEVKDLVPETIWTYREVGHTQDAKKEVLRILGGTDAPVTPKPVSLIERILWIATGPGDLILDATVGTGTTGHTALAMNAKEADKPPRHFVLIQQAYDTKENKANKLNLCEKLTAARVRRAITGYDYTKRGAKGKTTKMHDDGLGGTFTYVRVGEPLFGEYKDFGEKLPAYEDIAKYVYYTETSREFPGTTKKQNPAWVRKAGRIGEHAGRSYYLLYEPNEREDRGLDRTFLSSVASQDPNRDLVVYCERLAVHQDELRKFHREHGKRIRHMLVPFNLK